MVTIEKANISPVKPNTLKFTQVSKSKLKATYKLSAAMLAKKTAHEKFNLVQMFSGRVKDSAKNCLIIFFLKI